ncbi:hypothetical protein QBC33DRAFT_561203 [Phialemonium atrogriseum]|uniref:Uncharacterized protein n=1 Tax=Phialemonium atrogriseum TaxID=1093897 RepID=A0AAJ0BV78_9PEZI|nr:uncharacterized protein QBC33DRAFT_561203 [Phialemonium atrogriseum]KAK1764920.1 hypothetical protein QBC33DRAFT_561203 [Phialemonium atrogriseum]
MGSAICVSGVAGLSVEVMTLIAVTTTMHERPFKDPRPGVPFEDRLAEMKYVGIILQMAALVAFVLAINCGGVVYAWDSGAAIGLFVCLSQLFILLEIHFPSGAKYAWYPNCDPWQ